MAFWLKMAKKLNGDTPKTRRFHGVFFNQKSNSDLCIPWRSGKGVSINYYMFSGLEYKFPQYRIIC